MNLFCFNHLRSGWDTPRSPTVSRIYHLAVAAVSIALLVWPVARHAQTTQGVLDAEFGVGGKVVSNTSRAFKRSFAIALQRRGKIVVVGYSNGRKGQRAFVGQYNQNGTPDAGFGDGGFAGIASNFEAATAVVVQPNRKIVVGGRVGLDFGLARLNRDGSLDPGFGSAGIVATDFFGRNDSAYALALQPDGKMVVAGSVGKGHTELFGIARYTQEGGLDPTFGNNGKVTLGFSANLSQALTVALQPDGKIVAAGMAAMDTTRNDFALVRLNADGSRDSTFGVEGLVTTDFSGGFDGVNAVVIQPDGKIVAVGESDSKFALARYDPNGRLDLAFGSAGKVETDFFGVSAYAAAAALQADGKVIAVGGARRIDQNSNTDDFAVARFQTDGTLDSTFAQGGKLTIDFLNDADSASSVVIQKDGRVVIAGTAAGNSGQFSLAMARLMGE